MASLSRRAAVVDWDRFGTAVKLEDALVEDSFLNFDSQGWRLRVDRNSVPSLYVKSPDSVYPIFMSPRNGALPLLWIRNLSSLVSPDSARPLFTFLCVTFIVFFGGLYVRKTSGFILSFFLLALTSPQIYYFNYSQYPDASVSVCLFTLLLFLIESAKKRSAFVLLGFLAGLTLYLKLSAVVLLIIVAVFYLRRLKADWRPVLLGALPWLMLLGWTLDWPHLFRYFVEERYVAHHWGEEFFRGLIEMIAPDVQFRQSMYLSEPLGVILRRAPIWLPIASLGTIGFLGYVLWKGTSVPDRMKLAGVFLLHQLFYIFISPAMNTDLFSYLAQAYVVLSLLLLARLRLSGKIPLVLVLIFCSIRGVEVFRWNAEFEIYTKDMKGCGWVYACMYRDPDIRNRLERTPLITLNYLDVGQLEFLSGEKIKPVHLNSRWTRPPTSEELLRFFEKFPGKEVLVLSSFGLDGKTLLDFLGPEARSILARRGLKIEELKSFRYPEQHKAYRWLLVTRF